MNVASLRLLLAAAALAQGSNVGHAQSFASTGLPPQPYAEEWKRTRPDFVVFVPAPDGKPRWDDEGFCGLNEQLMAVPTAEGDLLAFWTSWGPKLRWLRPAEPRGTKPERWRSWRQQPSTTDRS